MYADKITAAMKHAIDETERRRERQARYNEEHGITPETIRKAVFDMDPSSGAHDYLAIPILARGDGKADGDARDVVEELRSEMLLAAERLDFEEAADIRDRIAELERKLGPRAAGSRESARAARGTKRRERDGRRNHTAKHRAR